MDTIAETRGATSKTHQLHMYHIYKHQRATQYLEELYQAHTNKPTNKEKSLAAIQQIEAINLRIRQLNKEHSLPDTLGVIDYGVFIYGWGQKKGRILLTQQFEDLCRRKQYMKGWSCLPPSQDYKYFSSSSELSRVLWDVLHPWYQLVWSLLKQQRPKLKFIDDVEAILLSYVDESSSADLNPSVCHFDALGALLLLHEMSRLLGEVQDEQDSAHLASAYDDIREELRRMCEFEGFPSEWP
jgi:hypothetical protein